MLFCKLCVLTILTFASGLEATVDRSGDVTEIENLNEVTKVLENSLSKLAAGEGPKYKLSKLHSAMEGRGVYGKAYYIDADLIDESGKTKICSLSTWSTYDSNEIKITFRCDGEQKLVRKHSL